MFEECNELKSLNLKSFSTENVDSMENMFTNCNSLSSLDLSSFNTPVLRDMDKMFYGCSSLTVIDISNLDTSNAEEYEEVFTDLPTKGTIIYNSNKLSSAITQMIPSGWTKTDAK